jgi:uncharacterized protein YoxC
MTETAQTQETKPIDPADYAKAVERAQRLEAELVDNKKRIEAYSKFGDPDAIKGRMEDYELLRKEKAVTSPADLDKLIEAKEREIRGGIQKEIDDLLGKVKGLEEDVTKKSSRLNELEVVDSVFGIMAPQLVEDMASIGRKIVREAGRKDEKGIYFVDEHGETLMKPGSVIDRMGPEDFVEHLRRSYGTMFKATAKGGTGDGITKRPTGSGTPASLPKDFNTWDQRTQEEWMSRAPENRALVRKALLGG